MRKVIIYGAHLVAKELYQHLKRTENNMDFLGFAVTSMENNPTILEGQTVAEITTYCEWKSEAFVYIAMPEKFHKEVMQSLETLGFHQYDTVGLKKISMWLGKDIVLMNEKRSNGFLLKESENDYTWLDLYEQNEINVDSRRTRHYKFPIMTRFSREENFQKLEKFRFFEDYEEVLGTYRNLHLFPVKEELEENVSMLDMYMVMCHKDQETQKDFQIPKWTHSIQAGAALTDVRKGEFLDNTGENISKANVSFAEMTATYWIWKNAKPSIYKGLCHYRRHFDISNRQVNSLLENKIDVVLTTPRLVLNGIRAMFTQDTPVKDDVFDNMVESIGEVYGNKVCEEAKEYFESELYYPNNMVIAKSDIFDDYCEFVFSVLFKMEEHDIRNGVVKNDRHIAFAAELLTSFYFVKTKDNYKIAVTDYIFLGR